MPSIDDWRRDWVSEDHLQRQQFAKNALQRSLRSDVQRRVSSSSSSSSVSVVDCCWAKGHRPGCASLAIPTALAPYLFCALSDGVVCVLNTTNFVKIYLFDDDTSRRAHRRDCLAAIDCIPAAPDGSAAIVCAIVDGAVCTFTMDPMSPSSARAVTSRTVHRAAPLPRNDTAETAATEITADAAGTRMNNNNTHHHHHHHHHNTNTNTNGANSGTSTTSAVGGAVKGVVWDRAVLRFSRGGDRVAAIVLSRSAAMLCVLTRIAGGRADAFAPLLLWTPLSHPEDNTNAHSNTHSPTHSNGPVEARPSLLHVDWWDDTRLLTVWDNGDVALIDANTARCGRCPLWHFFQSRAERRAGRLTAACAAPPPHSNTNTSSSFSALPPPPPTSSATTATTTTSSSAPHAAGGAIALVVDRSVVVVLHAVSVGPHCGAGLALRPAHQSYCSQEIPVRDVAFFDSFLPHVLAVLLESGACLTFDATTMEPLHHRPVPRLLLQSNSRKRAQRTEESGGVAESDVDNDRSGCYYIRPRERPLAMCVIEHNTAVVMRPT